MCDYIASENTKVCFIASSFDLNVAIYEKNTQSVVNQFFIVSSHSCQNLQYTLSRGFLRIFSPIFIKIVVKKEGI